MRLGVLGGTFDPIHFGHLLAAEETRSCLRLDRVLFVPAGIPPHKRDNPPLPSQHRTAMVQLAIAGNPDFHISSVDIDRPGPHYTVDTIDLLRREYGTGAQETFFIMGADSLIHLLTWHRPQDLIESCRLAAVARPGYRPDLTEMEAALPGLGGSLAWVEMPVLGIASSDLQRRVKEGQSIRYQTPDPVRQYITDHSFYRE